MKQSQRKTRLRQKRHRHVRTRVEGTAQRPRLCVFRSNKHIYAQVIDDWAQHTLVSCSSLSLNMREQAVKGSTVEGASAVGTLIGKKCVEGGIDCVVFDRGGYKYHGRVKALAEAARAQFREAGAKGF